MSLAPQVLNFYAGPTALPGPVVERIRRDLGNFNGTGMGVMEISHRAPEIEELLADTAARSRRLLGLDEEFEVLFVQGGGSLAGNDSDSARSTPASGLVDAFAADPDSSRSACSQSSTSRPWPPPRAWDFPWSPR